MNSDRNLNSGIMIEQYESEEAQKQEHRAKMEALKVHTRETNLDCYVIWEFTDKDMYYKVDPGDFFKTVLGRNTYTTDDLPHEYKPQHLIPMSYLTECSADMFEEDK